MDRLVIKDDIRSRLTESVETAFKYANNLVLVGIGGTTETRDVLYSQNYACPDCNISFEELSPRMFYFYQELLNLHPFSLNSQFLYM